MSDREQLIKIIIEHPELAEQISQLLRSVMNETEGERND